MSEERYKQIKDSIELQSLVKEQLTVDDELLQEETELLNAYEKLKDNWIKLKEYIDIKLYNTEYLQRLCGCKIDDETHMILDIIKEEMQELEESDSND